MKHDEELAAAMQKLAAKITDRQHLEEEIAGLKDQVIALLGEQMLASAAVSEPLPVTQWVGDAQVDAAGASEPRRPVRKIASAPALEALETIKASGPEGVPADKLQVKPWVVGLLARAHYAKKLPNGNWVAAK